MVEPVRRLFEWPKNGTRIAIILFLFNSLLVFGNLYLSNGYVSKTVYEADMRENARRRDELNVELHGIALELRGIKDHMEGDQRQDADIKDLNERVRAMELRK